jgi:formylglycine-generating enzyme required for sulfatase activity
MSDLLPELSQSNRQLPEADMVWIAAGTFRMGSDQHYPEEASAHRVAVSGFWIDRAPVTNRQFRDFVDATGYVTFAEVAPKGEDYPGALPHMLKAGALVFAPPKYRRIDLRDWSQWWTFRFGADCPGARCDAPFAIGQPAIDRPSQYRLKSGRRARAWRQ